MGKLNYNPDDNFSSDSQELMPVVILSIGTFSLVVSLFYGIKLKWFRYRMTLPTIDQRDANPVILRSHSVTEIRENCSTGVYRKTMIDEDSLLKTDIDLCTTSMRSSSITNNIKSKSSARESMFRWPFRSKITLSKNRSSDESSSGIITFSQPVERRVKNADIVEKNEKIRKSVFEHLNSAQSMPDLVQCDKDASTVVNRKTSEVNLTVQKGVEVVLDESSQYQTAEEIKPVSSIPIVVQKVQIDYENISTEPKVLIKVESIDDDDDVEIIPKPPTPPRRRSRSNSLRPYEPKVDSAQTNLPVITPRQLNIDYNKLTTEQVDSNSISNFKHIENSENMTPKSILKTRQQDQQNHAKTNVHFINVPDSSDEDEFNDDVWSKIDIHREQLTKKYDSMDPPPMPKTPPPSVDTTQKTFQFTQ